MSFVIATPDLVESAATSLAGIRSSLAEAAATAAGPTTGIAVAAQDEVSVAIASMFGNFGQQFQAVSTQAQAFHQQFVSLMNAGAGAYAGAETANAAQTLLGGALDGGVVGGIGQVAGNVGAEIHAGAQAISNTIAGSPIGLGTLQTGGAAAAMSGISSFGATVAAPYQALVSNTVTNLQAIGNTVVSNPFPFLHQLASNQMFYGQEIATAITSGIQNLPTELANLPATIQAGIQGLLSSNPVPYLQQLIAQQIGYGQTTAASLLAAPVDLITGLQALPPGFVAAAQDLLVGNNVGAYQAINQALLNAFLPGFASTPIASGPSSLTIGITPTGPLGDLAPALAIPGQIAQNVVNALPAGTVPAQIAQNATNLLSAFTNLGTTLNITGGTANLSFGIPLQLILDGIGAPANALSGLNSSAVAFVGALQAGNASAAAAALLDAPAAIANGFLNGSTIVALPPAMVSLLGLTLPSTTYIQLGGLLTPLALPQVLVNLDGFILPLELSGNTPVGGLIPGLLSFPAQLAADIAAT